jgi:transcriptional regulator with XRE-family HTH domain
MLVRIKEVMNERGVSSVKLAEMVNVSKVTISNLINNKTMPSIDTLEKIASALDVPIWQLFASPSEVGSGDEGTITCPHCGKKINLKVETEK